MAADRLSSLARFDKFWRRLSIRSTVRAATCSLPMVLDSRLYILRALFRFRLVSPSRLLLPNLRAFIDHIARLQSQGLFAPALLDERRRHVGLGAA